MTHYCFVALTESIGNNSKPNRMIDGCLGVSAEELVGETRLQVALWCQTSP